MLDHLQQHAMADDALAERGPSELSAHMLERVLSICLLR
jgi:hypothetical protein